MREYRNRICSAVLAAVCVIGTALIPSRAVHAEDVVDPIAVQKQAAYDAVPETNGLENWPQGPHVYANSAIVMEMNSGAILYGKKINDKHYPASITKLLTALVALENADPDDEVYFSEDSVSFLEYGDASIGMRPGEILRCTVCCLHLPMRCLMQSQKVSAKRWAEVLRRLSRK